MSIGVAQFSTTHRLPPAVPLNFTAINPLYATDFCHINAKDKAISKGKRVHGWALWEYYGPPYHSPVVVGNFHSVWEDESGNLVEVTPPKIGTKTLFVRDDYLNITKTAGAHSMPQNRTYHPSNPYMDALTGAPVGPDSLFVKPDDATTTAYCHDLGWTHDDWS
ncbi:hypothetical protein [Rhizobium laguerreae]|uniref:hypothetical protein n=1 Tax=Rhizobium laguerreae TaxID=1076926 RepID=UPI001442898A|nr:hypothetical protein [Rhizobium laguerreae]NKM36337.1 hypothetical protein [Rhizobium laguerreae]